MLFKGVFSKPAEFATTFATHAQTMVPAKILRADPLAWDVGEVQQRVEV